MNKNQTTDMIKTNVLLTSSYHAYDIVSHILSNNYLPCNVFCLDVKYNPTLALIAKHDVCPYTNSEEYLDFIISYCKKNSISVIIPCTNMDTKFFAYNITKFHSENIFPILSNLESIENASDKGSCLRILKENNIPVPTYYEAESIEAFETACKQLSYPPNPICIKPSKYPDGSGKGFRILDKNVNIHRRMFWELTSKLFYVSYEAVIDAMKHEKDFPPQLVMEYLPGNEFSVYCFCNNGIAEYIVPNLKTELDETNSKAAITKNDKLIIDYCKKICSIFKFDNNINIQFKYGIDGIPKVLEINPRLAGTIMLPVHAGVDLIMFSILKTLNKPYPKKALLKYGTILKRELRDYIFFKEND